MHQLLTTNELTSNAVKFWSLPFLQNGCDSIQNVILTVKS